MDRFGEAREDATRRRVAEIVEATLFQVPLPIDQRSDEVHGRTYPWDFAKPKGRWKSFPSKTT